MSGQCMFLSHSEIHVTFRSLANIIKCYSFELVMMLEQHVRSRKR